MTIASEITDLQTNLAAAKTAVTTKGGTVGDTGLAGLANEIATIPSGGSMTCKTDYGRFWYVPWVDAAVVDSQSIWNCTVTVDSDVFSAYVATNPLQDFGMGERADFSYDSSSDLWEARGFQNPVSGLTTAQLQSQLGITATVIDPGEGGANFSVGISQTPVVGADWDHVDLTSAGWTALQSSSNKYDVGTMQIPASMARRFEFGTVPTEIPNGFLNLNGSRDSGIVEIGEIPNTYGSNSLTGAFCGLPNLTTPLVLSGDVKSIYFNNNINVPIVYNPSDANTNNYIRFYGVATFNNLLCFGPNVKEITLENMNSFNQQLSFPDTIKNLNMKNLRVFNQSFNLPQNITDSIFNLLYGCHQFTSTVNVGNLSPDIINSRYRTYAFCATLNTAASYTQGIKIAGSNRAAWLSAYPDVASGGSNPRYRHLVDAGY